MREVNIRMLTEKGIKETSYPFDEAEKILAEVLDRGGLAVDEESGNVIYSIEPSVKNVLLLYPIIGG